MIDHNIVIPSGQVTRFLRYHASDKDIRLSWPESIGGVPGRGTRELGLEKEISTEGVYPAPLITIHR